MRKISLLLFICLSLFIGYKVKAYDSYNIGDLVSFNNQDYYVIKASDANQSYITALKAEPLTKAEIDATGIAVNQNIKSGVDVSNGLVAYYNSSTCGYTGTSTTPATSGCQRIYDTSDVKKVLDKWIEGFSDDLYSESDVKVRLLNGDDLYGIDPEFENGTITADEHQWLYLNNKMYWLDSPHPQSSYIEGAFGYDETQQTGMVYNVNVYDPAYVKPVLNIKKDSLGSDEEDSNTAVQTTGDNGDISTNKDNSNNVKVDNTLLKQSIFTIVLGITIIIVGITIYLVNKKRK